MIRSKKHMHALRVLPAVFALLFVAVLIIEAYIVPNSQALALTSMASTARTTPTCTVDPKHKKLQDVVTSEKAIPWKRNGAKQVTIYFESQKVTVPYKTAMISAARVWSRSPCVELKVVSKCPAKVKCVSASLKKSGKDPDMAGMFIGLYQGNYMIDGRLEFYTKRLSMAASPTLTAVAIHEMGHALGLSHRKSKNTIMSSVANPSLKTPSATEYRNLRVLYSSQK